MLLFLFLSVVFDWFFRGVSFVSFRPLLLFVSPQVGICSFASPLIRPCLTSVQVSFSYLSPFTALCCFCFFCCYSRSFKMFHWCILIALLMLFANLIFLIIHSFLIQFLPFSKRNGSNYLSFFLFWLLFDVIWVFVFFYMIFVYFVTVSSIFLLFTFCFDFRTLFYFSLFHLQFLLGFLLGSQNVVWYSGSKWRKHSYFYFLY